MRKLGPKSRTDALSPELSPELIGRRGDRIGLEKRVGLRAYARYRKMRGLPGGTLSAVQKALADGRISLSCPEHNRCPRGCSSLHSGIDPVVADQDWFESTAAPSGEPSAAEARATLDLYKARRERLRYERECGNLLSRAEVVEERFRQAKAVSTRLFAMSRRISGRLATMSDKRRIQEYVDDEIRRALDHVGRDLRRRSS